VKGKMQIKHTNGTVLLEVPGDTLSGADLSGADLRYACLSGADLRGADLHYATLSGAKLSGADLRYACLSGAKLSGANLHYATLSGADLRYACLERANLIGANLERANLDSANLSGAYLDGAYLDGAYLDGAYLDGANLPHFQICPEKGFFRAFKKISSGVIEIEIEASAKRTSSLVGRKCRASKVRVVSGEDGHSNHCRSFKYKVGCVVEVVDFDDDIRVECTRGIHFFMTRREAEEY